MNPKQSHRWAACQSRPERRLDRSPGRAFQSSSGSWRAFQGSRKTSWFCGKRRSSAASELSPFRRKRRMRSLLRRRCSSVRVVLRTADMNFSRFRGAASAQSRQEANWANMRFMVSRSSPERETDRRRRRSTCFAVRRLLSIRYQSATRTPPPWRPHLVSMGYWSVSSPMSRRIVRSLTPNSDAKFSTVSCRLWQRTSSSRWRRSLAFTPISPLSRFLCVEPKC